MSQRREATPLPSRARAALAGAALAGAALAAALLPGCGAPDAAASAERASLAVAAWDGAPLTLTFAGTVAHRAPAAHVASRSWVPFADLAPEGSELAPGAPLARLDTEPIERWRDQAVLQVAEQTTGAAVERAKAERRHADLARRRGDLAAQRAVVEAQIAATRRRDDEQLRVARLELDGFVATAARLEAAATRTAALAEAGHASRAEALRAATAAALARADVEPARWKLDLLETTTNAVTRRQREIELARLDAELAGVDAQLAALAAGLARGEGDKQRERRKLEAEVAAFDAVIADPTVAARVGGVVQYRDRELTAGGKAPAATFAWVLDDAGLAVEVLLPDRWRGLVRAAGADDPGAGSATIAVAALGRTLPARVVAIAGAPEPSADGTGRAFRCLVAPTAPEPGLRAGMAARVSIAVDAGAPLAVLPTWCIADLRSPTVELLDGSRRAIAGWRAGHRFVVTAGLRPGERVALRDAPPVGAVRAVGVLEAARALPVRSASSGGGRRRRWGPEWEITELVADGAHVAAGEVVARFAYLGGSQDLAESRLEVEMAELRAAQRLAAARSDGEATIAQALAGWRQAVQAAERARLDRMVAEVEAPTADRVDAEAALARAEARLARARAAAAEVAVAGAETAYAEAEVRARRLALAEAEGDVRAARLEAVARKRAVDHLALRAAQAGERDAETAAALARAEWSIARLQVRNAVGQAQIDHRNELNRAEWSRRQIAGAELRAPAAGRIHHVAHSDGRPLRVGDLPESEDLLLLPLGRERRFTIEVPARLYGRHRVGDPIRFILPVLGQQPRDGRVEAVAAWFAEPADARTERATRGAVVTGEKVFQLTVGFTLADGEEERAPLGATAYVDL